MISISKKYCFPICLIFVYSCFFLSNQTAFSQANTSKAVSLNIPRYYKEIYQALLDSGKATIYAIEFDKNSNKILPQSEPQIRELSILLMTYKKIKIFIVAHTNNDLDIEKSIHISQKQAESIRDELGDNYLTDINRISPKGLGYLAPITEQKTELGKKLNRRIEIVLQ